MYSQTKRVRKRAVSIVHKSTGRIVACFDPIQGMVIRAPVGNAALRDNSVLYETNGRQTVADWRKFKESIIAIFGVIPHEDAIDHSLLKG